MKDRTGDDIDPDGHTCRRGWLTPHDADNPVPCPLCRPALYRQTNPHPHETNHAA